MRRFLRQCLLFSVPLLLAGMALFVWPYETEAGFDQLRLDCHNGSWMQHRLFHDPTQMDLVCLGSSRMMCGISDSLLSEELPSTSRSLQAVNLGYCRYGRSLPYALAKLAFEKSKPRILLIEVRQQEDRFSHPDFPYVAESGDILSPLPWTNQRYFSQLGTAAESRFHALRKQLLGLPADSLPAASPYWFSLSGPLLHIREEHKGPDRPLSEAPTDLGYELGQQYPRHYLRQIASLAQQNDCRLVFLFLPDYQSPPDQLPWNLSWYETLGEVLLPPDSIVQPEGHWMDPIHLNETGARALTKWVAGQLREELR